MTVLHSPLPLGLKQTVTVLVGECLYYTPPLWVGRRTTQVVHPPPLRLEKAVESWIIISYYTPPLHPQKRKEILVTQLPSKKIG